MDDRFDPNYRKKPHVAKPQSIIYDPENNLDRIISITIDGPNSQIIQPININISRPYIKHVVSKNQAYQLSHKGVKLIDLGEMFKTEAFNEAIIFEFYKESDKDKDPDARATELYGKLCHIMCRRNLPLDIRLITMPDSRAGHHQENERYLVLQAKVMDGYNIRRLLVQ